MGMTRRVEIKSITDFENPLFVGESVRVVAELVEINEEHNYAKVEARIIRVADNTVIVEAELKFLPELKKSKQTKDRIRRNTIDRGLTSKG